MEYGDPGGVPVLAFHGTLGSRPQLVPAHVAARNAGVRLVALDRFGYGHSMFAPERQLREWPSDVVAVADDLTVDRLAVLGVSGGRPHAPACAVALAKWLAGLGVVSTPCPLAGAPAEHCGLLRWLRSVDASGVLIRLAVAVLIAVVRALPLATLRLARRWMPAADRRFVDDAAYSLDASHRMSPTTARAAAQDILRFSCDWRLDLGDTAVPAGVWDGPDDRLVEPWNSDALAKSISGAGIDVVAGEGDLLFAERAEDVLHELAAIGVR